MNELPEVVETKRELTFTVPNILLKYEGNPPMVEIRMGGSKQIEFTTSVEYVESPVDESNQLFIIKAKNRINIAGVILDVVNDQITGNKPIAPSAPTATEYMAKVGKSVLTYFSCRKDVPTSIRLDKDVYRVVRTTIVLP